MNSTDTAMSCHKIKSCNQKSYLVRACIIWGLAALFYFYDNLLQISPSAMKPELSLAFAKEAEQFGSLSAYFLYAYGFMQIPAGVLMDRFGPRRLLTFACAICALGSLFFGVASTLWEAKFGRVLIGFGASFAVVGCLKIASVWFPPNRFAFMTGLTITVGFLGAAFGLSYISTVIEVFGWRESMQWAGIFGLALSVILWLIIRDKPPTQMQTENRVSQTGKDVLSGLAEILKCKQTWIAATYAGLMFVPTLAFGGLWGIPFLVEAHGFDRGTAGMFISMIYIGWMVGGPCWGFISDYIKRRNLPMMIASVVTFCICLALIYLNHLPHAVLIALLFGLGFFSSSFILAYAVVQESNPSELSATAVGFTNAMNTLWGAAAQPFIGKILDVTAIEQTLVDGARVFSLTHYRYALTFLPISLVIACCLLLFLKETYCRRKGSV